MSDHLDPSAWCPTPGSGPTQPMPGYQAIPTAPPNLVGGSPSSVCAVNRQRFAITGMFRDLLTKHFGNPAAVAEPALRNLVWSPTQSLSKIDIESVYKLKFDTVGKRPAICIKPNSMHVVRTTIGDRATYDGVGSWHYSTQFVGSHTLFAITTEHGSTELLANEVAGLTMGFAPVLVQYLRLLNMQVMEVGAVSDIEEAKDAFAVPMTVAWAYTYNWKLTQEALKLTKVQFEAILQNIF